MHEQDPALDAIRKVRREISARFDHDLAKLGEHYMELQRDEKGQKTRAGKAESKREEPAIRA